MRESIYNSQFKTNFTLTFASNTSQEKNYSIFNTIIAESPSISSGDELKFISKVKKDNPDAAIFIINNTTLEDKIIRQKARIKILYDPYSPEWIFKSTSKSIYLLDDNSGKNDSIKNYAKSNNVKLNIITGAGEIQNTIKDDPSSLILHPIDTINTKLFSQLSKICADSPKVNFMLIPNEPQDKIIEETLKQHSIAFIYKPIEVSRCLQLIDEAKQPSYLRTKSPIPKILVVDDEPTLLDLFVDTLSEGKYEVHGVPSGTEAIRIFKEKGFDVGVVDFQLNDMTGLSVARELKAMDEDVSIIIATAHASLDMAVKAIQADVYDYLIKPVDPNHLKRSVSKALEKRNMALEIKALVESLKKANQELERLSELKTKFLSIVTHDIRAPLTSIKGYAQVLNMQDDLETEQRQKFLRVIVDESAHMERLTSDLMDFVSMEAGKLRVEKEKIDPNPILKSLKNRFEPIAKSKELEFSLNMPAAPLPNISGDAHRLGQVFTNLVSNAIKHTPAGGKITLDSRIDGNKIVINIADTGEGILQKDLPKVFHQFYQAESSMKKKREGIGLGLAISKEIVQTHEGEISVASEGRGKGTTFTVKLPILEEL